ncbi:MAG: phage portal protein [Candidatus Thiodiazotropha lotti]|nr:phage portal protein [Candidatus Thiodiazotropha lotti]
MNWFTKLFEKRNVSSRDPYLAEKLSGVRDNAAGQYVSPETATGIAAVHACVQLIAETVASLPLAPYLQLNDGSKVIDKSHVLYRVLHDQANPVQSAFEFREQFIASCLLTGNGYARIVMNNKGEVTALEPLHPSHVNPVRLVNGRIRYEVATVNGTKRYIQDEILHLRYRSTDGFTGLSPVTIARNTIGTALAQQQFEGSFFRNGATLSGALKHPGQLGDEAYRSLKTSFQDQYSGTGNAFKVMVLEEGMSFEPISMSQQDAQFVESRRLTLEDIARIYRIPPPAIGILHDATYSNITEQSRSLVKHTLRPWLVRIEQAMNSALLSFDGQQSHFIEHNADGLLRGAIGERYEAYRIAREWGWLNVNEIRSIENMGSIGPMGDTYRQPMNTEPLGSTKETPNV